MGNVNKVFLMGNMTRDPELRYTPGGTPVCDFGLAVNRNYTTKSGQKKEEVCFVDVNFWARKAEVICEYFGKGDQIFVEGRLKLDQWETPEGKRSKLKVTGDSFEFCGKTSGGTHGTDRGPSAGARGNSPDYSKENHPARGNDGGGNSRNDPDQGDSPPEDTNNGDGNLEGGYHVDDGEIPF